MIIIVLLTLYVQISFVLMNYNCITGFELKGNLKPCNLYHP